MVKLVILCNLNMPVTSFVLALEATVAAKLVMLSNCFLTSFILTLAVALVVKLAILGILFSIFLMLALYTSF